MGPVAAAAIAGVVLVGGLGWWWFGVRDRGSAPGDVELPTATATPPADRNTASTVPGARPEPLDLPALAESDGVVRDVVGLLSRHPRWAAWLVTDRLAERFVASVASVAAGTSPTEHVPFLEPEGDFQVREAPAAVVVDPASYRRYDALTEAFVSFDTRSAVQLYQQLLPLFEEAHRSLGFPEGTFGETFAAALDVMLAVEVPEEPPAVELDITTYLFVDPTLEGLTRAEKHLLRLGPENARQVQAKLEELRNALAAVGAIPS